MATAAQHDANLANARLSTGPRTEDGKSTSAQNARRHGLTGKTLVLDIEDREAFEQLRAALREDYCPASGCEEALFEAFVESEWRLNRLRRTEVSFQNQCIKRLRETNPGLSADAALGLLIADPDAARQLRLFLRYQAAIEHAWRDASKRLNAAIAARLEAAQNQRTAERIRAMARPSSGIGFVSQPPGSSIPAREPSPPPAVLPSALRSIPDTSASCS